MVFVDFAYFGLGYGADEDRKIARTLLDKCDQIAFGFSYSKNASLYEHRAGLIAVKTNQKDLVESNLQNIVRKCISMAPGFGQEIMIRVYDQYLSQWITEIDEVRADIDHMREKFVDAFPQFEYMREGRGMFGLLNISSEKIKKLREDYSIYLAESSQLIFLDSKIPTLIMLLRLLRKYSKYLQKITF